MEASSTKYKATQDKQVFYTESEDDAAILCRLYNHIT